MKRIDLEKLARDAGFTEQQIKDYFAEQDRNINKAKQKKANDKKKGKKKVKIFYGMNTNSM